MAKLTDKQELFAREYLKDLNATRAAIRAGYSEKAARNQAHRMMTNDDITQRIAELNTERVNRVEIDADYCSQCTDLEFCALIEHELYHICHAKDEFGAPKFNKEGQPVLTMRGHDVEEFVGVVRRYGASVEVQEMIDAANNKPEVGNLNIARACGTCLLKLA